MPDIHFYLSSTADPVTPDHPLWDRPLPRYRNADAGFLSDEADTLYKDYFSAIAAFCESDNWAPVTAAVTSLLERPVTPDRISSIWVFLEKHGAFYHPARLQIQVEGRQFSFVINVAVSACGRKTLPEEIRALSWLHNHRPFGWVPEVYHHRRQTLSNGREMAFFLRTWFDGYHEFHLSRSKPDRPEKKSSENPQDLSMVVWDGAARPTHLSEDRVAAVYQQASLILSACYDLVTTKQIFPWHHAAGDFVVRFTDEGGVSVRLITVRGRAPVLAMPDQKDMDETAILDGLMFFFIHLTLQMRLDREDGVGKVVWAPETTVCPVITGFFQGLDLSAKLSGLPDTFPDFFRQWFIRYPTDALYQRARTVTETFFPGNHEEQQIVARHLKTHLNAVCLGMQALSSGG
ncbi:hypothetical protein LJC41_03690 [Desulfosarcina sp. OttesenSCG-928-G17]|nr:hypothetical protein [Desulfosarcina sp. OttesenSCG-928-G17]